MSFSRLLLVALPLTFLPTITVSTVRAAPDNLSAIRLDAQPPLIRADGRSTTTISAQVYDDRGNVVADGTRVRFTTTAGRLSAEIASTQNGVARVTLTSADQPGTASIIAVLDTPGRAVPARLTVAFTNDAEATDSRIAFIRISGTQYIGYAADKGIVQANGKKGGASISYRSLTIAADTLQFDVRNNRLLALDNVRLTVGGKEQRYDHVVLNLFSGEGTAERIDGPKISAFTLAGLKFEPTPFAAAQALPPTSTFALTDLSEARITVVSRGMMIEPGRRLQFRRATFYVDGAKAFSAPLHIMSLNQDSIFPEQLIGYSDNGIMIDFPIYYQADPSGFGALNIRRAARVSSAAYSVRPGWSLDLTQNYNGAQSAAGTLEVTGLSRADWGMRLRHAQRLTSDTTGNAFIDFPNHRSIFATTQAVRTMKTFSLNTVVSGSRSPGYRDVVTGLSTSATGDYRGQIYGETFDRQTWGVKTVRYTLSANIAQQNLYGVLPIGGQPRQATAVRTESLGMRLFTTSLPIAHETTFRQSVSFGHAWVQASGGTSSASSGATLLGTTLVSRRFRGVGAADLTYDYAQTPLTNGVSAGAVSGRHRLGLGTSFSGSFWEFSFNGSRSLDVDQSSLISALLLRFGGPWSGRVTVSSSRFTGLTYKEAEYSLIRRIADRDFALYYSTTSRRFQLDLTGARF